MMEWFDDAFDRTTYGGIEAVLFSVPTEWRKIRVLIAGRAPPYRCLFDMLFPASGRLRSSEGYATIALAPDHIREFQYLLTRALRGDTSVSEPPPGNVLSLLGSWVDALELGRDRIRLGSVGRFRKSISVLLVGIGRATSQSNSPAEPASVLSQPRSRIVVRMRCGGDIMYGSLDPAAAEGLIAAFDRALTYPLVAL